jgi:hypothetical protein
MVWMESEEALHKVKAVKKARNKMRKAKKAVMPWKSLSPKADFVKPIMVKGLGEGFEAASEVELT